MVVRAALLAVVRLVAPVGAGRQPQADVVLPRVAVVAADHVAPANLALDAADAAVDGLLILVFLLLLRLDRLRRRLHRRCRLLAALGRLALGLLRRRGLVQIAAPVVALVGAPRASCLVCRQSVSLRLCLSPRL